MSLGEQIRKLRKYLDETGEEFGGHLGIGKSGVSMIETGERKIDFTQLKAIVDRCNIDPRYFFGMIDEPSDADLNKERTKPDYDDLVDEIRDLKRKVSPVDGTDQIAHRVT